MRRALHRRSVPNPATAGDSGEDCQRDGEPRFEASSSGPPPRPRLQNDRSLTERYGQDTRHREVAAQASSASG